MKAQSVTESWNVGDKIVCVIDSGFYNKPPYFSIPVVADRIYAVRKTTLGSVYLVGISGIITGCGEELGFPRIWFQRVWTSELR